MQYIHHEDMRAWDRFFRVHFINSLSGFKSASLLGTSSGSGRFNLAIFSNLVHIGADPALIGFINRPREAAPHTLANIEASGYYTINHITEGIVRQAHQTSAKYGEDISEFEAVGLQPQVRGTFPAPYVSESQVQYGMRLEEVVPLRQNGTFLVIGAVEEVWLAEGLCLPDGFLDLERAGSITSLGVDAYYQTRLVTRLSYARPGQEARPIL